MRFPLAWRCEDKSEAQLSVVRVRHDDIMFSFPFPVGLAASPSVHAPTDCYAHDRYLGLPACDLLAARSKSTMIITASLWQARQPVYTGSVERRRHYAPYLPELLHSPGRLE